LTKTEKTTKTSAKVPHSEIENSKFTSADLREQAGLTYRQVNDWDSKGILPPGMRGDKRSWRRYTARELFVILVSAELRKRFGATADQLRWVQSVMLQEKANHFSAAADMMSVLGLSVFILTNFKSTFIMENELEFADLWKWGAFHDEEQDSFALLHVNPLVNRLLAALKTPIKLRNHDSGRAASFRMDELLTAKSQEEIDLLRLVRNPNYTKLEVTLKDGEITHFRTGEELEVADVTIQEVLDSADFQTVEILKKKGSIARVKREKVTKARKAKVLTKEEAEALFSPQNDSE